MALITFTLMAILSWITFSNVAAVSLPVLSNQAQLGNGVDLRVLPIGDSITWGAQSSDSNGYRSILHDLLVARGNNVEFVGGTRSGNMSNPEHEGHRKYVIDDITKDSGVGINSNPNIVLLHAGTNDMYRDVDVQNAPARLGKLIDVILKASPGAVVLVCQIIPSTTKTTQARIDVFNAAIPDLVADYVGQGEKMAVVPMNEIVTLDDLKDNLHPNDGGYAKMAQAYFAAIEEADAKDWMSKSTEEEISTTKVEDASSTETSSTRIETRTEETSPSTTTEDKISTSKAEAIAPAETSSTETTTQEIPPPKPTEDEMSTSKTEDVSSSETSSTGMVTKTIETSPSTPTEDKISTSKAEATAPAETSSTQTIVEETSPEQSEPAEAGASRLRGLDLHRALQWTAFSVLSGLIIYT